VAGKKDGTGPKGDDRKKARLAEKLRANLQRRKSQARSRRAGDSDQRPDGLEPAHTGKEPDGSC